MAGSRANIDETGLTPQQRRFADEYLTDYDGQAAYKRAGYKSTGAAARTGAAKLLAKQEVKDYLRAKSKQMANTLDITAERVLREVARLAFFNPQKIYDGDGNVLPVDQWDADTAAAVAGLTVQEIYAGSGEDRAVVGFTKKVQIASKADALGKLMQHLGLTTHKVELSGNKDNPPKLPFIVVPAKVVQADPDDDLPDDD